MIKKFFKELAEFIKEEKFFILGLTLFFIIFIFPVDYYIITGGGTKEIGKRVIIDKAYNSKGSLNMCYVSEIKGTLGYYLLSYLIPGWERDKVSNYKYDENESIEDINFRDDLSLKEASSTAIKWAYKLASKEVEEIDRKIYVTATFKEFPTSLKIQDEIISIAGKSFNTTTEYHDLIEKYKKGDTIEVKVKRNKKEKILQCKLHELEGSTILGVVLQSYGIYETNPKITFNFKNNESGPSAGLMTTLDIYNKLTKKDITNSLDIAGTGTIEEDGTIGSIGGVKYKLMGAAKSKMDIFLVPVGENYKEALKVKKEKKLKIKIISIKNIKEAIKTLNKLAKS